MIIKLLQKEEGMALPIVMMIIAVVTLLGFTSVMLVNNQTVMGKRYENSETALAIAEAGINQCLWHLNQDSKFYTTPQGQDFLGKEHDFKNGKYIVEIDAPDSDRPTVKIKSTGWLNGEETNKFALEVEVQKRQFVQYAFLSELEETQKGEKVHWSTGDVINGPVHTNGTLYISGRPVFNDRVTYSKGIQVQGNPVYNNDRPEKVEPLEFPKNNDQLKELAQNGGNYFVGRTCILLDGNTIRIKNKNNPVQTITDFGNGVIYVDGNTSKSGKWDEGLANVFVAGRLNGRLTIAAKNDIYIAGYDPTELKWSNAKKKPQGGVLYYDTTFDEQGNVIHDGDDMLGLIANQNIYILHGWFDDDFLDWLLEILFGSSPEDITIHAAVFALKGSFEYENYDAVSLLGGFINILKQLFGVIEKETVTLVGSICQYYRGAVGMERFFFDSGYDRKHYSYDRRMAYDSPPHFLEPENAGWEIVSWKRVAP